MASKSIVSKEKRCIFCDTTKDLHRHHIFFGNGRRKLSEKYGCWCFLCGNHHNMTNMSVHMNKFMDLSLKKLCQDEWEKYYGTREDFIRIFGRNYL